MRRGPLLLISTACVVAVTACATEDLVEQEQPTFAQTSDNECEDAIYSFSVEPPFRQDAESRRRMLALIRNAQLERYEESCSNEPGWRDRFDSAYQAQNRSAWEYNYSSEARANMNQDRPANAEASSECYDALGAFSEAISDYIAGRLRTSEVRNIVSTASTTLSQTDCARDANLMDKYFQLRSNAVAMSVIPGPFMRGPY